MKLKTQNSTPCTAAEGRSSNTEGMLKEDSALAALRFPAFLSLLHRHDVINSNFKVTF